MAYLEYTLLAAGGSAASLAAGILIYALVSFALMRPHTAARELGVSMRELFREVWIASFTQPLIPLYYVIGRRMGRARGEGPHVPVVLVHGYMQNRSCFLGLARAMTKKGIGPIYGFNYPWFSTLPANAARLDRFVKGVCDETGAKHVDVICHSMGGLVAMEMMRDEARANDLRVRRIVTIATPHAGVTWRGPLIGFGASSLRRGSKLLEAHAGYRVPVPCLSLYSTHDNVVHPPHSSSLALRGGRDVAVGEEAHLAILFSPKVAELASSFLLEEAPVPSGQDDDAVAHADRAPERVDGGIVDGHAS